MHIHVAVITSTLNPTLNIYLQQMRVSSVIPGSRGCSDACGLGSALKLLLHLSFPSQGAAHLAQIQ